MAKKQRPKATRKKAPQVNPWTAKESEIDSLKARIQKLESDLLHVKSAGRSIERDYNIAQKTIANAYSERIATLIALSVAWPSHLCQKKTANYGHDFVLCIHLPTGQVAFSLIKKEHEQFKHLKVTENDWDGHTKEDRIKRLSELPSAKDS